MQGVFVCEPLLIIIIITYLDLIPRLFDQTLPGGHVRGGVLESASLTARLAPNNAFAADNPRGDRNAAMIAHTATGAAFREAYNSLRTRVPHADADDLLGANVEAEAAGTLQPKAQRVITRKVDDERAGAVAAMLAARPLDDPMAYAFYARKDSPTARAIFTSYPGQHPEANLTSDEFRVIMARLFGVAPAALRDVVGWAIPRTNDAVDEHGYTLSAAKVPGPTDKRRHDYVKNTVHGVLRAYRLEAQVEPDQLFMSQLSAEQIARETRGSGAGIIPDIVVDGTAQTIVEIKVIGAVRSYSKRRQTAPDTPLMGVDTRARQVHRDYPRRANNLDREQGHGDESLDDVNDTPNDWYEQSPQNYGPVRRRLAEFRLRACAAGPRGEVSPDFRQLIKDAAAIGATRLSDRLPVGNPQAAAAVLRWHANCRIGMAIQKASARHLLDRIAMVRRGGRTEDGADDAATATTFGSGGPGAAVDAYRTAHYADHTGATPWRDVGVDA